MQEYQYFSSPIISPNNTKGYYLHIPPYDHKNDCVCLAIDSMDDYHDENSPPKVYQVRHLKSDKRVKPSSPPSPTSPMSVASTNTSSSSLKEAKLAEQQVLQQDYTSRYSIIDSVFIDPETNRHFHFNKLTEVIKKLEECKEENSNFVESSSDNFSANKGSSSNKLELAHKKVRPPIKSDKRNKAATATTEKLRQYNSPEVVRHTLYDKDLPRSSNSLYSKDVLDNPRNHQRLNQYDDDRKKESEKLVLTTTTINNMDNAEDCIMKEYKNADPPIYHSSVMQK